MFEEMEGKTQKHLIYFTLKKVHGCFLSHLKTAWFAVPLIAHGKWEDFSELKIYPKKILRPTNMPSKALEKDGQSAWIRRARKARKLRRSVRNVRLEGA